MLYVTPPPSGFEQDNVRITPEMLRGFQASFGNDGLREITRFVLTFCDGDTSVKDVKHLAQSNLVHGRRHLDEVPKRIAQASVELSFEPPLIRKVGLRSLWQSTLTGHIASYFLGCNSADKKEFDQPTLNDMITALDFIHNGPDSIAIRTGTGTLELGSRAVFHAADMYYQLHKDNAEPISGDRAARLDDIDELLGEMPTDPNVPLPDTVTIVINNGAADEYSNLVHLDTLSTTV